MTAITTIDDLQQHQLVILRRLRNSPLTEFDLSAEVADSSGWDRENAAERISQWLDELAANGWIEIQTAGRSYTYKVATLADAGRELVG